MKCNEKENCKVEFGECERLHDVVEPLVEWFRENQRDLPWRKHVNAYRVWISEIMLQQTRVEAVKSYYTRFLEELPDIKALAEVPEDRLLKLWEGLGYYNRARNLKAAAQQVMEEYNGVFPDTFEEIKKLKGIGSYTAGAISSFVYHQPSSSVLSRYRLRERLMLPSKSAFPSLRHHSNTFPITIIRISVVNSSILSLTLIIPSFAACST